MRKKKRIRKIILMAAVSFVFIRLLQQPVLPVMAADTTITVDLAEGSVSIVNGVVTCGAGGATTYTLDSSDELLITQTDGGTTATANSIKVNMDTGNAAVHITLSGVNISSSCAFELKNASKAVLTLAEGTTNKLKSTGAYAGLQAPAGTELTIGGSGSMQVTGGTNAAAIGGECGGSSGSITIDSGTVTATGNIGGGNGSSGSNGGSGIVTITGGSITVAGNIGGGTGGTGDDGADGYSSGGTITVTGGTITVTGNISGDGDGGTGGRGGHADAASIGDGGTGGNGGTGGSGGSVTIAGGTIIVTGNIGGSSGGSGGTGGGGGMPGSEGSAGNTGYDGNSDSLQITGGMLSAGGSLLPAPTNGTSNVYKTTIVLENVGTACAVFSLAIVLSDETDYTYGTTDMAAAAGGYLYIWLPDGAKTTAVQAETGAYTGLVTTITAGTATGLFSKTADTELPTIETVSPDGTGAPLNGEIAITFGETMHTTTAGSVSFDGGTTVLSSGNWSNSNRTYTVSYTALTNNTVYVISVSGFADISGNIMEADSTHSFTTVVMCGNGAYLVESDGDSAYSAGYTDDGLLHLTVNSGVSGFTFFGVNISVQSGHSGSEVCLFVHTRNGVQRGIMACKGDFDTGGSPYAAFNVRAGDVIEVYFVDGLTNDAGVNPSVL